MAHSPCRNCGSDQIRVGFEVRDVHRAAADQPAATEGIWLTCRHCGDRWFEQARAVAAEKSVPVRSKV